MQPTSGGLEGSPIEPAGGSRHGALGLDPADCRAMYRQMVLTRAIDRRLWVLHRLGRVAAVEAGRGREAVQVACAAAVRSGTHWLCPEQNDLGLLLALGLGPGALLASLLQAGPANTGQPWWEGWKGASAARVPRPSSSPAAHVLHAVGIAFATSARRLHEAVFASVSEAGTEQGDWHEAMNFASIHRLPLICVVQAEEDPAGGPVGVPQRLRAGADSLVVRAAGYGLAAEAVDGGDLLAVCDVIRRALDRAESGAGPTLVCARSTRLSSSSAAGGPGGYRPQAELEALLRRDPLERFRGYLEGQGLLGEGDHLRIQAECANEVARAAEGAGGGPRSQAEPVLNQLYSEV